MLDVLKRLFRLKPVDPPARPEPGFSRDFETTRPDGQPYKLRRYGYGFKVPIEQAVDLVIAEMPFDFAEVDDSTLAGWLSRRDDPKPLLDAIIDRRKRLEHQRHQVARRGLRRTAAPGLTLQQAADLVIRDMPFSLADVDDDVLHDWLEAGDYPSIIVELVLERRDHFKRWAPSRETMLKEYEAEPAPREFKPPRRPAPPPGEVDEGGHI